MKKIAITFFVFTLWPMILVPLHAGQCLNQLSKARSLEGRLSSEVQLDQDPPCTQYYYLGEGAFGKAYRVCFPDRSSSVYKIYKGDLSKVAEARTEGEGNAQIFSGIGMEGFMQIDPNEAIENDVFGLRLLQNYRDLLFPSYFRVAKFQRLENKNILKIEDIRGVPLSTLLGDLSLSREERDSLEARYREVIALFMDKIHEVSEIQINDWDTPKHLKGRFILDPVQFYLSGDESSDSYLIMIKPDNIIVEEGSGDFVLVDPY